MLGHGGASPGHGRLCTDLLLGEHLDSDNALLLLGDALR